MGKTKKGQDRSNPGHGGRGVELGNMQTQTGLRPWQPGLRAAARLGEKNIFHLMVWREKRKETGC